MIRFSCHQCKHRFKVEDKFAGIYARCPTCMAPNRLPAPLSSKKKPDASDLQALRNSNVSRAWSITKLVTVNPRWNLENETLCQVFCYTIFGYLTSYGRWFTYTEVPEMLPLAVQQLTTLGIEKEKAERMVEAALRESEKPDNDSVYAQLMKVGHAHAASVDFRELVASIYENADRLEAGWPLD